MIGSKEFYDELDQIGLFFNSKIEAANSSKSLSSIPKREYAIRSADFVPTLGRRLKESTTLLKLLSSFMIRIKIH